MLRSSVKSSPDMIAGIPADVFVPGNVRTYDTVYGPVFCELDSQRFRLDFKTTQDSFDKQPHFNAWLSRKPDGNHVVFSIRSIVDDPAIRNAYGLQIGERHPGVHAAQFMSIALDYLRRYNGPIACLRGIWENNGGTNRKAYDTFKGKHPHIPAEKLQKKAAFATWTGQQALKHGFTRVNVYDSESAPYVEALFTRPRLVSIINAVKLRMTGSREPDADY